jgi:hypothetical protein
MDEISYLVKMAALPNLPDSSSKNEIRAIKSLFGEIGNIA